MEILGPSVAEQQKKNGPGVMLATVVRIVDQVLAGLEHIHSFGIVYRDIKPENLELLCELDASTIKIIDFGISKPFSHGQPSKYEPLKCRRVIVGSLYWEILNSHNGVDLAPRLFGTLSVQLYLYYLAFPNDRRFTKYLVYGIYVIEFAQTILVAHDAFATFGYGFGDMDALTRMNCNWVAVPVMSAVAAGVGQVFYAYRIFILSKSQIIPIFIICISLTSSVAAMVTGIYSFQAGNLTKMNNWKITIAMGIWCGASPLCDILIAICMTYYLIMLTTNFRRTQMLVTKIIRLTIETGSVTAVVALLNFVLFIAFPHQTSYITPGLLVPKLYANAVYMVLNSRFQIIGGRDTYMSSTDMSIPTMMITSQSADGRQGRASAIVISNEEFDDTSYEMGQMNDKPQDSCMSLPA